MRQNQLIEKITASQLRDDIPDFRAGDTVRVHALIVEGSRERVQMFEGVVIKRHGSGISATYVNVLVRLLVSLKSVATLSSLKPIYQGFTNIKKISSFLVRGSFFA